MQNRQKQSRKLFKNGNIWLVLLSFLFSITLVSTAPAQMKKTLSDKARKIEAQQAKKQKEVLKPQYGGIYRSAMAADPRSLDPAMETAGGTTAVTMNTNNCLIRLNPEMTGWELELAESVKQIDDTTYEFKIHKGVKFHNVPPVNGREVTSEDVKYSIERVSGMHGKKSDMKHSYYFDGKVKSIETPDKYTIIFKLTQPFAPFLRYIASPWCAIVAKEVVDKYGDLKNVAIGTGPFILKEFIKGSHISLVKNPNYWKKGLPYLDGITWKIMPDPASVLSAFIAGRLDGTGLYHFQVDTVKKEAPDVIIDELPGTHMQVLRVQPWIEGKQPLKPPLDKKEVRQAIAMAIDKNKLLKLVQGGFGHLGVGPIPPVYDDSLTPADQVKYNPEKAKKMLAEAGYPNGFSIELITWNLPNMTNSAQVIKEMLKEIGIDLKLTFLEFAQYFNRAYRFEYQMSLHVTTAGVDPEEWLIPYYGPLAGSTYYKWSNPELWKLITEQQQILDVKKRKALIRDIQLKILDDAPYTYLYTSIRFLARRPYVRLPVLAGGNAEGAKVPLG
ncbi:MAG: ABC transporter substrate-binding protein [Deltaproteobacteria bacterium]|nr:ABC transporter substrate-binding protein [Deltaproteobacteria bacterium]